jgi:hypothetical protein
MSNLCVNLDKSVARVRTKVTYNANVSLRVLG